jgi:hypothetical protein
MGTRVRVRPGRQGQPQQDHHPTTAAVMAWTGRGSRSYLDGASPDPWCVNGAGSSNGRSVLMGS